MRSVWTRFTSRKFLAALSVIAAGLIVALRGGDDGEVDRLAVALERAAGAIAAAIAAVGYGVVEARADTRNT